MQLEDHLGDIIRKARLMTGVPARAAAAAAGLDPQQWDQFERTGDLGEPVVAFRELAALLGLNGEKLAGIANGWRPHSPDLSRWQHLQVFVSADADLTVNHFLVWDARTREAGMVDTGLAPQGSLAFLQQQQLRLTQVFITHSHYDHIEGLAAVRSAWPAAAICCGSAHAPKSQQLRPGQIVSVGDLQVAPRRTPGHAEDGLTYVVTGWPAAAPAVAFVGDAIFAGSMGRGNDSWTLAQCKVREEILSLPPETLLGPGHGPLTTVGEELAHNPFF